MGTDHPHAPSVPPPPQPAQPGRGGGSITFHPLAPDLAGPAGIAIDEGLIRLLDESLATMRRRGDELARNFYDRLFRSHPELRAMFPADLAGQRAKLLETLGAVTQTLRATAEVRERLHKLGELHRGKSVRAEQYPIVCGHLLAAMREVSGEEWTPTLQAEWGRCLQLISTIMQRGAPHSPRPS